MSNMFGGKNKTTSVSQTTLPPWYEEASQNLINGATSMGAQFLRNPVNAVAGFNPDQMQAFEMARENAQGAFTQPTPQIGGGATSMGSQINPAEISSFMSPFLGMQADTTLNRLRDDFNDKNAELGARYAAAGAFGGSREAVGRANLAKNYQQTLAETLASLGNTAYTTGANLASQNANLRQQTAEGNANRAITAAQANSGLLDAALNRQRLTTQDLLGIGSQQQQFHQNALDIPWTTLNRIKSAMPGATSSTTTQTTKGPNNTAGSALSLLLGLL